MKEYRNECKKYKPKIKSVSFNFYHDVIFINYDEIVNSDLWWCQNDYNINIKMVKEEVSCLLNMHPFMNFKDAKKLLYQPNNISYNSQNFS